MKAKYENTTNHDINIYKYHCKENSGVLVVYEYSKESENKKIVLGKYIGNSIYDLNGKIYVEWLVSVFNLINGNNLSSVGKLYYIDKFLNNRFTSLIKFTKEGYDLLTNKYLYLNNEIYLNVLIEKEINLREVNINEESFFDFNDLNETYFFSEEELNQIDDKSFIRYLKDNLDKINNYIKSDEELLLKIKNSADINEEVRILKISLFNKENTKEISLSL